MRLIPALLLAVTPFAAFAAGSDDTEPPKPTETSQTCKNGQVWDDKTRACVNPEESRLDDDARFRAVRELAWAGRPADARRVLAAMHEGDSDRVMTYDAFTLRISGRIEDGLARYEQAISANPANILARSYYGQALVLQGEYGMAREQLAAIDNRESWAWRALNHAIETGVTANY